MTDVAVLILVGREARHIVRCLERLAPLEPRQVFVVESQKGDATHALAEAAARRLGWRVEGFGSNGAVEEPSVSVSASSLRLVWHDWPGTQARQFNWALDNLPLAGAWILRLDADEYLTEETVERLRSRLEADSGGVDSGCRACDGTDWGRVAGLTLELKRRFCGGEIRHATAGIRQVRVFRRGRARYDESLMDERLCVGDWTRADGTWRIRESGAADNRTVDFDGAFCDDSLVPMDEWRAKHRSYAQREAAQALEGLRTGVWADPRKAKYYCLPPYLRAVAYFCVRYFLKGGILDGYAGWMWNFWQGLWYRCLVDRTLARMKRDGVRK